MLEPLDGPPRGVGERTLYRIRQVAALPLYELLVLMLRVLQTLLYVLQP